MSAELTLVAFLRARLDELEQAARAAAEVNPPPWTADEDGWIKGGVTERNRFLDGGLWDNEGTDGLSMDPVTAEHVARHDPARVLADVQAKRRLLDEYESDREYLARQGLGADMRDIGRLEGLERAIELAALPHAQHEDYRAEWAVDLAGDSDQS